MSGASGAAAGAEMGTAGRNSADADAAAGTGTSGRRRILLITAYDGTNYCGWQVQKNGETIEGVLNRELSRLFGGHRGEPDGFRRPRPGKRGGI